MNKEAFNNIINGKELIVRKKVASFIEKVFRFFNYDFRHDIYKKIIYGEIGCNTPLEEKLKSFYDGYLYLLSNHKTPLTKKILNKFFYILFGKEVNQLMLIKIARSNLELYTNSGIEYVIDFHIAVYKETEQFNEEERFIISLMFFNYCLLKINVPIIYFVYPKLIEYIECRRQFLLGDKSKMVRFVFEMIETAKYQDKSYYKNLKTLTSFEVCQRIKKDKEMLLAKYSIKNIYLFGSFAKNIERIDSDIDLLFVFNDGITSETKRQTIDFLSKYYFNVFDRFIDIIYINRYLDDDFISELKEVEKIF